jgi:GAF domain-containing protein
VCESLAPATEAYAAYLSTRRGVLDPDEQQMLDEDLSQERAAMERARLEATLVRPPAKR